MPIDEINGENVRSRKKMWIYIFLAVAGLLCAVTAIGHHFNLKVAYEGSPARNVKTALSANPNEKDAITDTDITDFGIAPHTDKFKLRKPQPLLW